VPQGRHAHGLQLGGQVALESLFPGLMDEAMQAGAPPLRPGVEMRFSLNGNAIARVEAGTRSAVASRPLLDGLVSHGGRVSGVSVRERD
jgi:hypothetical protein